MKSRHERSLQYRPALPSLLTGLLCGLLAQLAAADHIHLPAGALELERPVAVALDAAERWYVLDAQLSEVVVFATDGTLLDRFGSPGSGPGQLHEPQGLAVSDERVYVADTGNDRVQVFGLGGEPLAGFGSSGSTPGQFLGPAAVATAGGRVYVADTGNDRIQGFTADGSLVVVFGERGSGSGQLDQPVALAIDQRGDVYVADRRNHRIARFDLAGRFVANFGGWGSFPGLLRDPAGLCWSQGRLFVSDRGNHRVQVFDSQGRLRYLWGHPPLAGTLADTTAYLHAPRGLAVSADAQRALVCEPREGRAQWFVEGAELDAEHAQLEGVEPPAAYRGAVAVGGRQLALVEEADAAVACYDVRYVEPRSISRLGGYGSGLAEFSEPVDVAIDTERDLIWVADAGRRRLSAFRVAPEPREAHVFDPKLASFVKAVELDQLTAGRAAPESSGELRFEPRALACGAGRLFVASARGRMLVLDAELATAVLWDARLGEPLDLAWDAGREELWIVERASASSSSRVAAWTLEGRKTRELAPSAGGWEPCALTALADGRVCVADAESSTILVFEGGELAATLGAAGTGPGEFRLPAGLAGGPEDVLYVIDPWAHRGQALLPTGRFLLAF